MNRVDYLQELDRHLRKLPEPERREVLADYEEHFRIGLDVGKTEGEISRSLGMPRHVAAACLADRHVARAEASVGTGAKLGSLVRAVLALVGLGFFNAVFVLGPFFGAVGLLIGLWALAISPVAAGFGLILEAVIGREALAPGETVGYVFAGIGLISGAGLLALAMGYVTRWFAVVTVKYVRLNFDIVAR